MLNKLGVERVACIITITIYTCIMTIPRDVNCKIIIYPHTITSNHLIEKCHDVYKMMTFTSDDDSKQLLEEVTGRTDLNII